MPSVITPVIDTAIGIVLIYIAFSLLTSWLSEQLLTRLRTRSRMLVGAITQLFTAKPGDATAASAPGTNSDNVQDEPAKSFFAHPIYQALRQSKGKDPQYLSAQQFSSIVLGLVHVVPPPPAAANLAGVPPAPAPFDFTPLVDAAKRIGLAAGAAATDTEFSKQLSALAVKANGSYAAFVKSIEDWYDDHMDRVSGWYVKHTTLVLVGIGFVLAALWNVDTLRLAHALSCNSALRSSVASLKIGDKDKPDPAMIKTVIDAVPIGWDFSSKDDAPPERALSCDVVAAAVASPAPATATLVAVAEQAADDKTAADRITSDAARKSGDADRRLKAHPKDGNARRAADNAKKNLATARAASDKAKKVKDAADKAVQDAAPAPHAWSDWNWWWVLKVIGLVLTAVALAQGAGFWFDTLSSLTRVREAGKKPDPSKDASRAA